MKTTTNTVEMTGNHIADFLRAELEIFSRISRKSINGYRSLGDFVLQHGRQFDEGQLKPPAYGRMKECFRNAGRLAIRNPLLTYCEGYALGVFPVLHAWCVTREGLVIDPTWKDGSGYYGVLIKTSYLCKTVSKYGQWGILDNFENDWPMLRAKKQDWSPRERKNKA